jgi:hypothetical protein
MAFPPFGETYSKQHWQLVEEEARVLRVVLYLLISGSARSERDQLSGNKPITRGFNR